MRSPGKLPLVVLLVMALAACASGPKFDTSQVDIALTPRAATAEADAAVGRNVLWGGVILAINNLQSGTRLEVLAYPLDDNQRPLRDSNPLGRFLVQYPGYLEPATYAEGRMVTVTGSVHGAETGKVGESEYRYPVILSRQLHLWSRDSGYDRGNVHFGIGVGIGL